MSEQARKDIDGRNIMMQKDEEGNIIHLLHLNAPIIGDDPSTDAMTLAGWYVNAFQGPAEYNLENIALELDKNNHGIEIPDWDNPHNALRFGALKSLLNTSVVTFKQTLYGIEIWKAAFSVTIQKDPETGINYVASSDCSLRRKITDEPTLRRPNADDSFLPGRINEEMLKDILKPTPSDIIASIESRRLLFYRYDPERQLRSPDDQDNKEGRILEEPYLNFFQPEQVPDSFTPGAHYAVSEIVFTTHVPDSTLKIGWRAFIDIEQGAVLQLWPFVTGCLADMFPRSRTSSASARTVGFIMCEDPLTHGGPNPIPHDKGFSEVDHDELDTDMKDFCGLSSLDNLRSLNPQTLSGDYVSLTHYGSVPDIDLPEKTRHGASQCKFQYKPYSEGKPFTAVNAYYHCNSLFRMMESLGYSNLKSENFEGIGSGGTDPVVRVDPLGWKSANERIGAWTIGTPEGGHTNATIIFGSTQEDSPVGAAADVRIAIHEFCHLLLLASIDQLNFDFAHSAGDSLAAILLDPDSKLRDSDDTRFTTFPWLNDLNRKAKPANLRYHGGDNREDIGVWGWKGTKYSQDIPDYYDREQVLSNTLFLLYRSLGGDATIPERRRFAARYTTFLIIQAIGTHAIPSTVHGFIGQLHAADRARPQFDDDELNKITTGVAQKVIDWAFEQRGYVITDPHASVRSDVYINDGRKGEYDYSEEFSKTEIWNRVGTDAHTVTAGADAIALNNHQPVSTDPGLKNFIYTRIHNGGQSLARSVIVKGYYRNVPVDTDPMDLAWDNKWTPMNPAAGIKPNGGLIAKGQDEPAGPFEWTPTPVQQGDRVCVLLSVSSAGDASSIDPYPTNASFPFARNPVPLWWLVPRDNNIACRVIDL